MASGVVKVGRRTYAVGLFWQPSPSGRVAQAAREAAQQPGQKADYFCVRAATKSAAIPQYGLGQAALNHKNGLPTLAASAANAQPGSWAGAFRLREGTWVIVVRDDLIAPDGDLLFDSDDQARERLLQEVSLGGVQRIYAPDGWAIPGSDPTPLPLILQDRADSALQPVHIPLKLIMYGLGAIAVIGLVIFILLQYQAEQERIAREAEALLNRQGAISSIVEEWQWPPAEEIYERKWETRPTANQFVQNCHDLFQKAKNLEYGWVNRGAECRGNGLSVMRDRKGKSAALVPDKAGVDPLLQVLSQSFEGEKLSPRGAENLMNRKDVSEMALKRGWPFDIQLLPDDEPTVSPPSNVKDPPPPPPPPWQKRGLKYSSVNPPWTIMWYLDDVLGVYIDFIGYDGKTWTIEATIYEMRGGG